MEGQQGCPARPGARLEGALRRREADPRSCRVADLATRDARQEAGGQRPFERLDVVRALEPGPAVVGLLAAGRRERPLVSDRALLDPARLRLADRAAAVEGLADVAVQHREQAVASDVAGGQQRRGRAKGVGEGRQGRGWREDVCEARRRRGNGSARISKRAQLPVGEASDVQCRSWSIRRP